MYKIENKNNKTHKFKLFLICVIKIIITFIAIKFVLQCNKNSGILYKLFISIIVGIFSEIYIIYYLIYRVYMGNLCPVY